MSPNLPLYLALILYATGTIVVLTSLLYRASGLQPLALGAMMSGFLLHTVWIGIICSRTEHPPLTNLPEAAAFIAWTILAVKFFLYFKYRVEAAAFFVYPLVLMLLTVTAVVRSSFVHLDPSLHSNLFIAHLFLTSVGVASLLIGLAFTLLYHFQQRSLKSKRPGRLFEWIPSLRVCEYVSYRAIAIGFGIYTLGILAGIFWSYRTSAGVGGLRLKEVGALVAWMLFAALLQAHISGTYRAQKTLVISAAAFISLLVAILGIHHV